jgi:hypothetical protein
VVERLTAQTMSTQMGTEPMSLESLRRRPTMTSASRVSHQMQKFFRSEFLTQMVTVQKLTSLLLFDTPLKLARE